MTSPNKTRISVPLALGAAALACGVVVLISLASKSPIAAPEDRVGSSSAMPRPGRDQQVRDTTNFSPAPDGEEESCPPVRTTKASVRPVVAAAVVNHAPAGSSVSGREASSPSGSAASSIRPQGYSGPARGEAAKQHRASGPVAGSSPAETIAMAQSQRPSVMPLSHQVTDEQVQAIAPEVPSQTIVKIREQFEQEAGVAELDPADPEYERRWQAAEPTAADRMRALYGWAAYAEFERQAALAAQP